MRNRLLIVCALAAATAVVGCGSDNGTTTTSTTTSSSATTGATTTTSNAGQKIDSAVQSCVDAAQQLGGVAGTALDGACKSVGASAQQAVQSGGEQVKQVLTQAASSCNTTVSQVPSGEAQTALKQLCDAIGAAGE